MFVVTYTYFTLAFIPLHRLLRARHILLINSRVLRIILSVHINYSLTLETIPCTRLLLHGNVIGHNGHDTFYYFAVRESMTGERE